MSISKSHPSDIQQHCCIRCSMVLPPTAAFCGNCGERVEKTDLPTKEVASIDRHVDIERYRITSLIQRIPYTRLYLAMDTQQQRPVAIRDIDIQQIDISSRSGVFKALEQEYDLLRGENSNDILPLIASFHAQNHLYSVSAWPLTTFSQKSKNGQALRIYTLQDLLQSGIGLPDEQMAVDWIRRLAHAVEHLHKMKIVIGTLDPSTILVSQKDYSGQPMLFPSWILPAVQAQLQQTLNTANSFQISHLNSDRTTFFSPEAKQGHPEMRSDIYSIGAILHLLVTGMAPAEQGITASHPLRSPHAINTRAHNALSQTILKAIEVEPSARFQSVNELSAGLMQPKEPKEHSTITKRLSYVFLGQGRSAEKVGTQLAEINFTSDKGNNKTEQRKAAQADLEINDDTISIAPIQKQLARQYLSRINTPKLGQEETNSDHEESIVENGYSEQTMQLAEEEIKESKREIATTAVEIVSGSEDGKSLEIKSDNTDSSSEEVQNTDNQQLSYKSETEETPSSQTPVTDAEQSPNHTSTISSASPELISLDEAPSSLTTVTDAEQSPNHTSTISSASPELISLDEVPSSLTIVTDAEQSPNHTSTISSASSELISLDEAPSSLTTVNDAEQSPNHTTVISSASSELISLDEAPSSLTTVTDAEQSPNHTTAISEVLQQDNKRELPTLTKTFSALLERIKRFFLDSQPSTNNAVAMIETPMRIQPDKNYTIRIHIMGRNEPKHVPGFKPSNDAARLGGGLGSLIHGEVVHIEVRSALYHNYAYIVQQTDVEVPAYNYAAEITIPMRSITGSSGTKRERLHIFFTDEKHNQLYEKPFLIELFISNLVKSGHEGHNVLTIPL